MMSSRSWWQGGWAVFALVSLLAACGGDGGNGGGTTAGFIALYAGSLQRAGSSDGVGTAAQFNLPAGVAQDAAGTIYVADTANHTVRRIGSDATVTTLAGAAGQSGSADGSGNAARFSSPRAVAVDSQGNVLVADTGNATVRKISPGGVVTTLAGAAGQTGGSDGSGATARFQSPVALALDSAGNLFVADSAGALRKIAPGGLVSTFAGATGQQGFVVADGVAARFTAISGVAVDAAGNVSVAERTGGVSGRVRRFDSQARALPWGNAVDGVVDVPGPASIVADGAGTVYVASNGAFAATPSISFVVDSIKMITLQGAVLTIAGQDDTAGLGLVDGPGPVARFQRPEGIAIGNAGRLVVADTQNDAIRLIDAQSVASTLAGGAGVGLVDGPREGARFFDPRGIAAHPDGTLDIADGSNRLIRRISPAGTVSTLSFTNDGTTPATFGRSVANVALSDEGVLYIAEDSSANIRALYAAQPPGRIRIIDTLPSSSSGIAAGPGGTLYIAGFNSVDVLDAAGNRQSLAGGFVYAAALLAGPGGVLYVADAGDHTVRAVDAQGHVALVAGQPGVAGQSDGDAAQATLERPAALALDSAGSLYVADSSTIRRITPQGQVRTVAGTPGQSLAAPGPLPGSIGAVKGLAWHAGVLYATVQNAVLTIGPIN
jgi:sugar lactone lactonase YvrE